MSCGPLVIVSTDLAGEALEDDVMDGPVSFAAAYRELFALATRRAGRVLRDAADAEEVAQEALLRAYVSWNDIEPFAVQWVSRVVVNLAISRLRQRHDVPPDSFAWVADAGLETKIDVGRAVAGLPLRQRQVVVLRHMADLSEREVAELLDISTGAVKRHLHRALTTLRSPSSRLATEYSITTTKKERVLASSWQTMFVVAVEPTGGWPTRPWDHRYVEDDGSIVRVAVDQSGAVVLDADGDEVQSGPGFDYEVAKVRRGGPKPERDLTEIPSDRLASDMVAVLDRAGRMGSVFGHCWVGTEHLGLALVELSASARAIVGVSWDTLARAVADLYEGPFAAARFELVTERLAGDWKPAPVATEVAAVPNWALTHLLQRSVDAAEAAGRREADATAVSAELVAPGTWSLVSRLLGR